MYEVTFHRWGTAVATLDFDEVASLVNHSRTTLIHAEPVKRSDAGWALYRGEHRVHTATYPFTVLSLQSRATKEALERAHREAFTPGETHVVYAPSLDKKLAVHKDLFRKSAAGYWTIKEYLASFIKDELDKYITTLRQQVPEHYIDPPVRVPAGVSRKIPNPLQTFLTDDRVVRGESDGAMAILLAEPGQGKTYMCRHLAATLAESRRGIVPIFIDSSQWQGLGLEDLSSLAKTITHSFRHFDAPISWLEGHEDQFLRVALKADLFRVVFDGFDEYLLRNRRSAQPTEVLETLSELTSSTGARLLLTSRTSFWDTNIPEVVVDTLQKNGATFVYEIQPFDHQHAKNYFTRRLGTNVRADEATQLYTTLRGQGSSFVGRGFVLSLIADLVERAGIATAASTDGVEGFQWLLTKLCEREEVRQQLPLSAEQQLQAFQQFATDVAMGEPPTTDTLEYAVGLVRGDLDTETLEHCIEKLRSHPLLERSLADDRWQFKQGQAGVLLLAEALARQGSQELPTFVSHLKLDAGLLHDLATSVVDLLLLPTSGTEGAEAVTAILRHLRSRKEGGEPSKDTCRLAAAILLTGVDRLLPRGSSHRERAVLLGRLAGPGPIRKFVFTTTIARFDLTGSVLEECTFEQVTWANCQFDDTTCFRRCEVYGGGLMHTTGFGSARIESCRLDLDAASWVKSAQIREGKRLYDAADLRSDLEGIVAKFLVRGGPGLKTVSERNLTRGRISTSRHKDSILEAVKKLVIEPHHVSGISEKGYNIRESAQEALRFWATNNVLTGPLAVAFEELRERLRL